MSSAQALPEERDTIPVKAWAILVLLSRTEKNARTLPLAAMRKGSPGELFAAAIATIQNQTFVRRVPWWGATLVLIGIALVAYRVPRMTRLGALGAGAGVLVIFMLVALAVFNRWLYWIPIVPVIGAVFFMVLYRIVTIE